ncbi:MAG: response regulator [Planctomycetota bacterium]|jgi:DNA-binding response OmpR family regulator
MAEKMKVLVIDDDAELRELFEQGLELAGFEVYLAGDGPSGIETAKEKRPSVIVLDVTMEPMNGLEVLSELKSVEETKDVPVFMLTGKSGMDDVKRAMEIGAVDYITKPVEVMKLGPMLREKMAKCQQKV